VIAVFLISLLIAGRYHGRIEQSIVHHEIWADLKREQIARLRLDWEKIPSAPSGSSPFGHPYASDLDLAGERSLHRLINTAITHGGSERLRDWFLQPELDAEIIHRRQALVRELKPRSLFRDRLRLVALLAAREDGPWDAEGLIRWLQRHTSGKSIRPVVYGLAALALVNIMLFSLYALGQFPAYWLLSAFVYAAVTYGQRRNLAALFGESLALESLLSRFVTVFRYLEGHRYVGCPGLRRLCAPFLDEARRPSKQLQRVARIAYSASLQRNPLLWFTLNALGPWDLYFAHRLENCKREIASLLPRWLDAWYELEALLSLAAFADLHPGYAFPAIISSADSQGIFRAYGLGHPLIPHEKRVCNDFSIEHLGHIVLLTGSNMSGKSTLMRTLGVNLCLAYAGGPVCAEYLEAPLFRLFTCIQVSDSVTDGLSHFYAEVKRLRALLDELERNDTPHPLFFLIDEIFRATNNRERLIGSRAYIQALVGKSGVGVITTHDLELVQLAEEFSEIGNFHFREEIVDDKMAFDYHLRPGPCPTTNALRIMALEGLPIAKQGDGSAM